MIAAIPCVYAPIMASRTISLSRPLDLRSTLKVTGLKGPSLRVQSDGLWRATRTSDGPVTVRMGVAGRMLTAEAWGPGSEYALDRVPDWIGESDDATALVPHHSIVEEAAKANRGMRMASVGNLVEVLIPTIIAQKVTGLAAAKSYRQLAARYGERAPGPVALRVPPDPEVLASLPYYDFHRLGIEQKRALTIIGMCCEAERIEKTITIPLDDAYRYLHSIRGIGPWTTGSVMRTVRGDPDAVPIGDYHVPNTVTWALAGEERGTDERMLELLEPYKGQRGRVVRLLERHAGHAPAYGPKLAPRDFRAN